jgi:SAM-dependent methyltransferase
MTHQIDPLDDWQGERAARWLADLDINEAMLAPLGEAILAHAAFAPGEQVLDVGCGGGATSRAIARAVGRQGAVLGIDIASDLLAEAERRARSEHLDNLHLTAGDAAVCTFTSSFDRIFSRLGIMFFAKPRVAFKHLAEALVVGGRADFAVWASPQQNPWMSGARAILTRHIDVPAPIPDAPGPFSLSDRDAFTALLTESGWCDVHHSSWEGPVLVGGGAGPHSAADFALRSFSFAQPLATASTHVRDRVAAELADFYGCWVVKGEVRAPGAAWLVSARRDR